MSFEFDRKRAFRKFASIALLLLAAGAAFLGWMYRAATSDPLLRNAEIEVDGLARPMRVILMSDIHVAGPDMPPRRLARILGQVNALRPDLVLIAGDLVSDKRTRTHTYSLAEAVAPLRQLRPRLGTIAVLGNHDHWRDAAVARQELRRVGIRVLDNDAVRVGPLTVGAVDDAYTGHEQVAATVERMRRLGQPALLLSHSPDVFPQVPKNVFLTLAGHTHCGQIRLPVMGAVSTMSAFGERYACGRVDEHGKTLIVSAELGTSIMPLRLGAPPDLWVVTLRPRKI
jgi:predicted MPP superfamily phosphohydrolase